MQQGEYITDRLMPKLIKEICAEKSIEFTSLSGGWLLLLQKGSQASRVLGYKFELNSSAASQIAQDKVATALLLNRSGVQAVPHFLLRSLKSQPLDLKATKQLLSAGQSVVIKPLAGSGGRDIFKVNTEAELSQKVDSSQEVAWAASPLLDIVAEHRLLLLDGELLLAYDKQGPAIIDGLKIFNLGAGATPKIIQPDNAELALARQALQVIGLRLAAVDIAFLADGSCLILEVNDGFMMEHFARLSDKNLQITKDFYAQIIDKVLWTKSEQIYVYIYVSTYVNSLKLICY